MGAFHILRFSFLLLILWSCPAFAYTVKGNPDKCLSIGFMASRLEHEGDYYYQHWRTNNQSQFNQTIYQLDMRIPVNSWFTLNFAAGYGITDLNLNQAYSISRWEMSGKSVGIGARIYLK